MNALEEQLPEPLRATFPQPGPDFAWKIQKSLLHPYLACVCQPELDFKKIIVMRDADFPPRFEKKIFLYLVKWFIPHVPQSEKLVIHHKVAIN